MLNEAVLNGAALNTTASVRSVQLANASWDAKGVTQPIDVYRTRLSLAEWVGIGLAPITSIHGRGAATDWTAESLTAITPQVKFAAEVECEVFINFIAATQPIEDAASLWGVSSSFEGTVRPQFGNTDWSANAQSEVLATKVQPLRTTWFIRGYCDDIPVSMHKQALVPIEVKTRFTGSQTFFDADTGITTEYAGAYSVASSTILIDPVISVRDALWFGVVTPAFLAYRVYNLNLTLNGKSEHSITATRALPAEALNWNSITSFTNTSTNLSVSTVWTGNHRVEIDRNNVLMLRGAETDWISAEIEDYDAHIIRRDRPNWSAVGEVADIECTVMVMTTVEWQAGVDLATFNGTRIKFAGFDHYGILTSAVSAGVVGKAPAPPARSFKVGPHLSDFYVNAIQQEFEEAA